MATKALPVRNASDVRLAGFLSVGGCPLCAMRAEADEHYLRTLLRESVNDVGVRMRLDKGRGFCQSHTVAVLVADRDRTGGELGASILFSSVVRARLGDLDRIPSAGSRRAVRAVADAARPPSCPACGHVASAQARGVAGLVEHLGEPAWGAAIRDAAFCLEDLLHVWRTAAEARMAAWDAIAASQLRRIRDIGDRLERFGHNHNHDRRHLLSDEERRSVAEAATLLGGAEVPGRRPAGGL